MDPTRSNSRRAFLQGAAGLTLLACSGESPAEPADATDASPAEDLPPTQETPDAGVDAPKLEVGGDVALDAADVSEPECDDPFEGGQLLGTLEFVGEGAAPFGVVIGAGLDARLYQDLAALQPDSLVGPAEAFFVRTQTPDLLPTSAWTLEIGGLVGSQLTLSLAELEPMIEPRGVHLMEGASNGPQARFGMLSAAEWSGVPIAALLAKAQTAPGATQLRVSGFDEHSQPSVGSTAGASWVFGLDDLAEAGAFLATHMGGEPLLSDHGAPLRLVVPGWYGCACIKWVVQLWLVGDDEPATSQMVEFAPLTHQAGIPTLARDFAPAIVDLAAVPIRVERWQVGAAVLHRVVGVVWGGAEPAQILNIRFGPNAPAEPVVICPPPEAGAPWSLWSHPWTPLGAGPVTLRLAVADPDVPTRRLDAGYYDRVVQVG